VSLTGLLLLQGGALAGLLVGRRRVMLVPLLATVPGTTQLVGVEVGALVLLSVASFALGTHLRSLVSEQYAR
jgi:hypothetical protein